MSSLLRYQSRVKWKVYLQNLSANCGQRLLLKVNFWSNLNHQRVFVLYSRFSMHQLSYFRTLTENLKPCRNGPSAKSANRGLLWNLFGETRKMFLQLAMQTFIFPHLWGEISSLANGLSAKSADQVQLTSAIQKDPPASCTWSVKHPFLRHQIATE